MGDAMGVCDDERGRHRLGLHKGLERVLVLRPHGHAGDIDIAVSHRNEPEILLGRGLAAGGEFRDGAPWGRLGLLPARVGIDFRVQHQHFEPLPLAQSKPVGR